MKYLILFLQILFIKCFHRKYLIYPFIQNKYDNLEEIPEIISELSSLEYYTNITIAEPPQTIRSFIDFTKFHFYISNVSSNREYILENSNSFNTKYDHEFILYTYSFVSGKYANETLTVDLKNINSSFSNKVSLEGYTLIPLKVYFKDNKAKLLLGLCKGKKDYDKRESIKERDIEREISKKYKR